jgi:prepilin-type N-terminal cleavage/methylation domain-containing protein
MGIKKFNFSSISKSLGRAKKHRAFSLIEISLVILIIGVLIGAILGASDLVFDARIRNARSITENSPIISIPDLELWFETVSERSFGESEASDGVAITRWNNIAPDASSFSFLSNSSAVASNRPVYTEDCIDSLPCLSFNGVGGSRIFSPKPVGIRSKYISAFLVFTGPENATPSFASQLISSDRNAAWNVNSGVFSFSTSATASMSFVYNMPSTFGIKNTQANSSATLQSARPYIYSVIDDNSSSIFQYVNGAAANTSGTGNSGAIEKSIGVFEVGSASYQGKVGEIIIFSRALSAADRRTVEQYLAKKWGIALS